MMFEHVDAYAGDPILSLVETFKKDPRNQSESGDWYLL